MPQSLKLLASPRWPALAWLLALSACDQSALKPRDAGATDSGAEAAAALWQGASWDVRSSSTGGLGPQQLITVAPNLKLCEFLGEEQKVRCRELPSALTVPPGDTRVLARAQLGDVLCEGERCGDPLITTSDSVTRWGGRLLVHGRDRSRHLFADAEDMSAGSADDIWVLLRHMMGFERDRFLISRHDPGNTTPREPPLERALPSGSWAEIVLPFVIWGEVEKEGTALKATRMLPFLEEPTTVPIGRLAGTGFSPYRACRTANGIALAVGQRRGRTQVVFERNGSWSVVDAGEVSLFPQGLVGPRARVDCAFGEVVISRWKVESLDVGEMPRFEVEQVRCSPLGCKTTRTNTRFPENGVVVRQSDGEKSYEFPTPSVGWHASKPVIVFTAPSALYMRLGDLGEDKSQLLLSEPLSGARLFPFEHPEQGPQLVVLATHGHRGRSQVVGVRVDAKGGVSPITRMY